MISRTRYSRAMLLMLAAGFSAALVLPARAQAVPADENPEMPAAEADAPEANDADIKARSKMSGTPPVFIPMPPH